MDVSVVAASGIREFYHVAGFEFESESLDKREAMREGQAKFLNNLKTCITRNPMIAQRLGRLRYKLRASRIRAV